MNTEDRSAANRRVAEWMGWTEIHFPGNHNEVDYSVKPERHYTVPGHWLGYANPDDNFPKRIPDLWADSPEGAAWRWRVMEKLIKSGWYLQVDERYIDMGHFYVVFRQWGSPKVADALYPSLTEAMAMALHAAVVALEGEEVR